MKYVIFSIYNGEIDDYIGPADSIDAAIGEIEESIEGSGDEDPQQWGGNPSGFIVVPIDPSTALKYVPPAVPCGTLAPLVAADTEEETRSFKENK